MIRRIMAFEECVIHRSRRFYTDNTPPRSAYPHIIRKSSSIIVLLFIQNIFMTLKFIKKVTDNKHPKYWDYRHVYLSESCSANTPCRRKVNHWICVSKSRRHINWVQRWNSFINIPFRRKLKENSRSYA